MFFRCWVLTFAIIGLIVSAFVANYHWDLFSSYQEDHARDRQYVTQNNAEAAEKSPQDCRPAMVEGSAFDWLACLAEKITADSSVKQAEYDLKAQQDMAAWAFGMLIVTIWLAAITFLGVVFVGWTLAATRKMAFDTRDMMGKQMRAYLAMDESYYPKQDGYFVFQGSKAEARIPLKNFGATPATGAKFEISSKSKDGSVLSSREGVLGSIAPGATQILELDDVKRMGNSAYLVDVKIAYETVDGNGSTKISIRSDVSESGTPFSTARLVENGHQID